MGISEAIIGTILDKLNVEQKDIDKATEILDMVSFTKENGKDIILIKVGDNVEIKIKK
tara:strand:+ start:15030 stop:15203 length:174 start_codon:yes stop_codon:yes gene_type:complete